MWQESQLLWFGCIVDKFMSYYNRTFSLQKIRMIIPHVELKQILARITVSKAISVKFFDIKQKRASDTPK